MIPTGTVTFLFTDIEGSTRLWQDFPAAMTAALARHHEILNEAITLHHGYVFQVIGDGFHAAFASACDSLNAALAAQRALGEESWGDTGAICVRMALHTDRAQVNLENYTLGEYATGEYLVLARTARLLSAGHGGQILVSEATAALVREQLPPQVSLRDLGSHRVKDFEPQQIFQATVPDLRVDFPPLKTLGSLPNNLPVQLTSFVGRQKEIAQVEAQLAQVRLLTLTGPGGAGKTRLSLQVAADEIDHFAHGVWFIELAPLSDPALVPQLVATTFHLREQAGRTISQVLQDYLRDKNLLLVLDNCEHLIEAGAALADTLLRNAPQLKILASSRQPLGILGEVTYPVPSLSFPGAAPDAANSETGLQELSEFEAVRLFIDRARAVQPNFAVTDANAAALVEICQRLDGIPLALELAAARVKGMTLQQIARRLDDRFRLLTGGSRTAMPRHQTLQAAVEWSYDLLADEERVLLQRLAVFAGGWTMEAAEAVCAGDERRRAKDESPEHEIRPLSFVLRPDDVLDLLMRLVDKSLVVVDQQGNAARYHYLDSIRQFASEKLVASGQEHAAQVRERHLDYFLGFVETIDRTVRGQKQESGLEALDKELDNVRAALSWAAKSGNTERELRLASALWRYWRVRSYFSEGRRWLEDALRQSENAPASVRARALLGAGSLANYQSDYMRAGALLSESLALHRELDDKQGAAYCLNLLSHALTMTGELDEAEQFLQESLAIFRELGDTRGIGYALFFMGSMLIARDDPAAARPVLEESLQHLKRAGDKWWVGNALGQLGWTINRQGEHSRALEMFNEALEISNHFGDARGTARAQLYIAEAKFSQDEFDAAKSKYREALKLFDEIGDRWWATVCLEGLAAIAARQNEPLVAARLLGAAEHLHDELGAPVTAVYRATNAESAAIARTQLGSDAFLRAWNEGRGTRYEEVMSKAVRGG